MRARERESTRNLNDLRERFETQLKKDIRKLSEKDLKEKARDLKDSERDILERLEREERLWRESERSER